jgi:hypothetical protein
MITRRYAKKPDLIYRKRALRQAASGGLGPQYPRFTGKITGLGGNGDFTTHDVG